ncbi:EamA/RhaT family transporter (fragment) [Pseudomonas sp. 8AS]
MLMGLILFGLLVVLDIPTLLVDQGAPDDLWFEGVLYSLVAAGVFAVAMWVSDRRLAQMAGAVRSMLTVAIVFLGASLAGASGVMPGGLLMPGAMVGWIALAILVLLYGTAFSILFICMPRLDLTRNAPVMNIEPVAGLLFGWLILDQQLGPLQLAGAAIVVAAIVMLAYRREE